ncbi:TniB family NTP-binding protein [Variovorax sp. J22R115]|uniref:TniB family NTP-binding protein n=1 Tax=Variovorax sp. J22R115 TaxID=3053509 RepID=UPI00257688DD|nr:TniB family NTP-binding protein [Variovorax sp. J22R115]MDM0053985.1 TniB family NTP-binding protein [Variovorax sp. J22R115]
MSERQQHIRSLVLAHPLLARILDAIRQRVSDRRLADRGLGILIIAPPDAGKSTLLKRLETIYPRSSTDERDIIPYVWFSVPGPCTKLRFANAILRALGDPLWDGKDANKQADRAEHLLSKVQTVVIGVDNAQDIPEQRKFRGVKQVGSYMRDLVERCKVVLLMVGTDDSRVVVQSNQQLRRRVPGFLPLGPYDILSKDGLSKFLRMAHMFDENLPLADPSGLAKGQMGKALAFASNGTIGCLADLLVGAVGFCVNDGREALTLHDLSRAFRAHFLGYADTVDPFSPGFKDWRRLDRPGEPFFTMSEEHFAANQAHPLRKAA